MSRVHSGLRAARWACVRTIAARETVGGCSCLRFIFGW